MKDNAKFKVYLYESATLGYKCLVLLYKKTAHPFRNAQFKKISFSVL